MTGAFEDCNKERKKRSSVRFLYPLSPNETRSNHTLAIDNPRGECRGSRLGRIDPQSAIGKREDAFSWNASIHTPLPVESSCKKLLGRGIALLHDARWKKYDSLSRYLVLAGVLLVMYFPAPASPDAAPLGGGGHLVFLQCLPLRAYQSLVQGHILRGGRRPNLWANVATTIAANCVSVEKAPRVTLLFAIVAQLIPFVILLWSDSPFWLSPIRRTAGVFILLLALEW